MKTERRSMRCLTDASTSDFSPSNKLALKWNENAHLAPATPTARRSTRSEQNVEAHLRDHLRSFQ